MGRYQKIENLYKELAHYKDASIINLFKEVFYLEKVEGSSAFVRFKHHPELTLEFYGGGQKQTAFEAIFDKDALHDAFFKTFEGQDVSEVTVFGEVYGGKIQKMTDVYGPDMRFVAFEVRVGDTWLSVPNAEDVATKLGLDFVPYVRGPATKEFANEQRDKPSDLAKRLGMGDDKFREGVIIRPLVEFRRSNGKRVMVKHKAEKKRETKKKRKLSEEDLAVLSDAQEVADEWVVEERLTHVLSKLQALGEVSEGYGMEATPKVIKAMIADVKAEGEDEIEWSKPVGKAITDRTVKLFKKRIQTLV